MRLPPHRPWSAWRGALVPVAAVVATVLLLLGLGSLAGMDGLVVPKPDFAAHRLAWPEQEDLLHAGLVVDAALWWLCLVVVLAVAGLVVLGLGWAQLWRATVYSRPLRRVLLAGYVGLPLACALFLAWLMAARGTALMPFSPLVQVLAAFGPGFPRLAVVGTASVFVVGIAWLAALSLQLVDGAHESHPTRQMESITRLVYAGAAFLLVTIGAGAAMYRLCASLLTDELRKPMLGLAPTVSLMGGLMLSLMLAAAYVSASLWLQHRHALLHQGRKMPPPDDGGPQALLRAHWPQVVAVLMPMLPGVAETVMQALAQAR